MLQAILSLPILLIHFIITSPGEDASRQVNVNWHSSEPGAYLQLVKVSGNKNTATGLLEADTDGNSWGFPDSETIAVKAEEKLWSYPKGDSLFQQQRYVCSVSLDNLEPGTDYRYRIIAGKDTSEVCSFTTASGARKWNFLAYADFQHAFNEQAHRIIAKGLELSANLNEGTSKDRAGRIAPLVICSGDMIDTGANEESWRWILGTPFFHKFIYASAPGDHEFWGVKPAGEKHIPQMETPATYNAIFNNPKNGVEVYKNSNYYFYYNNVLFVALTLGDSNTFLCGNFILEAEWFRKTILPLKGTYDYLVVFGHKSVFGSYKEDRGVRKYLSPIWYPVFTEAGVDLVVSGHDHMYSRTYPLENDCVSSTGDGTYYLDLGSSGNKYREPDEGLYSDGLHAKVLNLKAEPQTLGASVSVNKRKMEVRVFNLNGETVDSFTIPRKRR